MKICLVTGIFPPDIGGPATYVSTFAKYIHSIGWQVEIVTYADSTEKIDSPFLIHKIPRDYPAINKFMMTRRLVKQVAGKSDIAYINGLLLPAASALARKQIPKVAKIVGDPVWERAQNTGLTNKDFEEFQDFKQPAKIRFMQHLRNKALARMDKIIVPSEYLRTVIEKWGFGDKVKVIFNGIAPDYGHEFRQLARLDAKKHIGIDGWVILSVGRLCKWKGFDAIVRSLTQLDAEIKLLIVGDGPEQEQLARAASMTGTSKRVIFAGRVRHDILPLYFRDADCFILNSGYEGFPHVVLEAMAMECPVIAANKCGTRELIRDGINGILIEKDDVSKIVRTVSLIRKDTAKKLSIIKNGFSDAQKFTWNVTAEKTVQLLESMV